MFWSIAFLFPGSLDVGSTIDGVVGYLDDMEGGAASGQWRALWSLDMPANANFDTFSDVPYRFNNMPDIPDGSYSKVAYYLQLDDKWVLTTMDAFTDDTRSVCARVAPKRVLTKRWGLLHLPSHQLAPCNVCVVQSSWHPGGLGS